MSSTAGTPDDGTIAVDGSETDRYAKATIRLRRRYWTEEPAALMPDVVRHVREGSTLLDRRTDDTVVASSVAESALLASRIAFFDLRLGRRRTRRWQDLALAAADTGRDDAMAVAVLGHMAFEPAWGGRGAEARGVLDAARDRAARGGVGPGLRAWLEAVASEAEVRLHEPRAAFPLLDTAAEHLAPADPGSYTHSGPPEWFDWFSGPRLDGFRGAAELAGGRNTEARVTLQRTLDGLPDDAGKQRAVTLADLSAAAVALHEPEEACRLLNEALDLLGGQAYATGVERVRTVRSSMGAWRGQRFVREVDERLKELRDASRPSSRG